MSDLPPSVYIETSIISYLCARDSRVADVMARQQATRLWWAQRNFFRCFVSNAVIEECRAGDPAAAQKRIDALHGLQVLEIDEQSESLANLLLEQKIVPGKARQDAVHIAIATLHQMHFLLTWNCRHMANADVMRKLKVFLDEAQLMLPTICTPEIFLGESKWKKTKF